MRDIPVFTTENGVASLIFKEIPYSGTAYVRLQDTAEPVAFLQECADFCRAVGAEHCLVTGAGAEEYPLYTIVSRMQGEKPPKSEAAIFPVTEETLPCFLEIYNEKMAGVPIAAHFTKGDGLKLIKNAYFVHIGETLLGIGIVEDNRISAIAACQKGAGDAVLSALCAAITGDVVFLEVAEDNLAAVRLYERCGFVKCAEIARWYKIF